MEKMISLRHHFDDYECMWNGIEDLYMAKTGERIPDFFFFALAGLGNFLYLRTPKSALKRLAVWNDGRTGKMYARLAPEAGFTFRHTGGISFETMLKRAKKEIDAEHPVVLGCLDMYELPYYPKFFHRAHIPIHYILMIGYSDEKQCAYILDCGLPAVQELSYTGLAAALDIEKTILSDKNTLCTIRFAGNPPGVREIAASALASKARAALNPPAGMLGIKGMRKLANEFGAWKDDLSPSDYIESLINIVTFTGTVPLLPDALLGPGVKSGVPHRAAREKLTHVLDELSDRFEIPAWRQSAQEFKKSGDLLSQMTDRITDFILENRSGKGAGLDDIPARISEIAEIEELAFRAMQEGAGACKL